MLDVIFSNYFEIDNTEYFITRWPLSSLAELVDITSHQKWDWKGGIIFDETLWSWRDTKKIPHGWECSFSTA